MCECCSRIQTSHPASFYHSTHQLISHIPPAVTTITLPRNALNFTTIRCDVLHCTRHTTQFKTAVLILFSTGSDTSVPE